MSLVEISSLSWGERVCDWLMWPVMKTLIILTTQDMWERPQETHFWNNTKGDWDLDRTLLTGVSGDAHASPRWWWRLPLFHLGGWREYVVLKPAHAQQVWFVGWKANNVMGVSRLPLFGSVRLLRGREDVHFFGINAAGMQIPLCIVGYGRLGDRSKFRKLPLR